VSDRIRPNRETWESWQSVLRRRTDGTQCILQTGDVLCAAYVVVTESVDNWEAFSRRRSTDDPSLDYPVGFPISAIGYDSAVKLCDGATKSSAELKRVHWVSIYGTINHDRWGTTTKLPAAATNFFYQYSRILVGHFSAIALYSRLTSTAFGMFFLLLLFYFFIYLNILQFT